MYLSLNLSLTVLLGPLSFRTRERMMILLFALVAVGVAQDDASLCAAVLCGPGAVCDELNGECVDVSCESRTIYTVVDIVTFFQFLRVTKATDAFLL